MRANVIRLSAQWDSAARQLQGCNSLEILTIGTRSFVIAAGEADGRLSSYEIMADGSLQPRADVLLSATSGTQSVRDLSSYTVDGVSFVIPAGRYDDNTTIYRVEGDGSLTPTASYSFANLVSVCGTTTAAGTFVYTVTSAGGGVGVAQLNSNGTLSNISFMADSAALALNDVSAMCHANLHGKDFMFAASTFDAGVQSFRVGAGGALGAGMLRDDSEIGFFNPTAMVAVQIDQRGFVVMGSAGTDELVVMRVSQGGKMKVVDRMVDTNETRFEQVSTMKLFHHEGHDFILAGGSDDGFSILHIDYRGRLHLVTTIADDFDTTLNNIDDIEIASIGGRIFIFAASSSEHGFTQFELVLDIGETINGGRGRDVLVGTAGNDILNGYGGRDEIYGHGGDDILIDGRGTDRLYGGTGADIFRFRDDGKRDFIMDFEIGIDRIDLSDYAMLYSIYGIEIQSRKNGALLTYRDDEIRIFTMDVSSLTEADFSADDFIFL
ncbi:MAG: M10 family metallopeptidase C-terminal domain-containing protein [Paracoccaceae bacterium]